MIESCWNRRHDNCAVLGILPLVRIEISQPSQKQGPVIAAHQFLADPHEFVDEARAFCPPPASFFVAFPPNNTPVVDLLERQCVLVPFASGRYGWIASGAITPFGKANPRRTVPQFAM